MSNPEHPLDIEKIIPDQCMIRTIQSLTTRLFRLPVDSNYIECRHCGTRITGNASVCPVCGSKEIAYYNLTATS